MRGVTLAFLLGSILVRRAASDFSPEPIVCLLLVPDIERNLISSLSGRVRKDTISASVNRFWLVPVDVVDDIEPVIGGNPNNITLLHVYGS